MLTWCQDLGLGVLEQCGSTAGSSSGTDSESDNEDVMAKLMGHETKDVSIQEVGSGQDT